MKTLNYKFDNLQPEYDLSSLASPEEVLFLDIETTGFSPKSAFVYLIGAAYYQNGCWNGTQWFAQTQEEEDRIIKSFFQFAKRYRMLIHFNGNQFDLPFLEGRIAHLGLNCSFDHFEGIDLYKRILPCRNILRLDSCKQKSLETFLGLTREDRYNGGELISVYKEYTANPSDQLLEPLLIHNRDDLWGLVELLPLLAYSDLFNRPVKVHKVQANHYKNYQGQRMQELMIYMKLSAPVPIPLSIQSGGCHFRCENREGVLRVPVYNEEMKFFYSDYKNYYYLPEEDVAMHKSVASFVEKSHRIQATAATCYTRKFSSYLPQWDYVFEPFFKREYKSPLLFFELTEEFKTDRKAFSLYASHLLSMLGKGEKK
ncbi:MAG: ribonuclease H-like domain-containing protein [Lachnospiraceae bacterium]|nr:ribonuclease H-like domain-containing protein [Lachnospiraceae bacterium]